MVQITSANLNSASDQNEIFQPYDQGAVSSAASSAALSLQQFPWVVFFTLWRQWSVLALVFNFLLVLSYMIIVAITVVFLSIWTQLFSCSPSLAAQSAQASKSQGKQLYLETFQFNITVSLDKFRQKPFPHTSDTLATLGLMFVCCQSV